MGPLQQQQFPSSFQPCKRLAKKASNRSSCAPRKRALHQLRVDFKTYIYIYDPIVTKRNPKHWLQSLTATPGTGLQDLLPSNATPSLRTWARSAGLYDGTDYITFGGLALERLGKRLEKGWRKIVFLLELSVAFRMFLWLVGCLLVGCGCGCDCSGLLLQAQRYWGSRQTNFPACI